MSELRRPPAFQVYAADELARAGYYALSLAERGLLDAMRRVIWCDDSIPADAPGIALAVRRPEGETRDALTERVLRDFQPVDGDPSRLTCPELRRQMTRLLDQRQRQSDGADKTNRAKRDAKRDGDRDTKRSGDRDTNRNGEPDASELNRTEQNQNRTRSLGNATDQKAEPSQPDGVDSALAVDPAVLHVGLRRTTRSPTNTLKLSPSHSEWVDEYRAADADHASPIAGSSVASILRPPGDMMPTAAPANGASVLRAPAAMDKHAALDSDAPIPAARPVGPEFNKARARKTTSDARVATHHAKATTASTPRNAKGDGG